MADKNTPPAKPKATPPTGVPSAALGKANLNLGKVTTTPNPAQRLQGFRKVPDFGNQAKAPKVRSAIIIFEKNPKIIWLIRNTL